MEEQKIKKVKNIRAVSLLISIIYMILIVILTYTNPLFEDIYSNTIWLELSFILFVTYLLLYIKDAVINDYIELIIEKKDKSFIPHLLEHTLEPVFIYFFFLGTTWLLLLEDTDNIITRIIVIIVTPTLYFGIKKTIETYIKKQVHN